MDPAYLDRLERLARLKADGTLSQAEFDAAKVDLLNAGADALTTPASLPPDAITRSPEPPIDETRLSATWQRRFAFMDQYGLPTDQRYKTAYRQLSYSDKRSLGLSPLAFLFGPFYLWYLGLWRPALTMIAATVVFLIVFDALKLASTYDRFAFIIPGGAYMVVAIPLYYLNVRRDIHSWNPLVWWGA